MAKNNVLARENRVMISAVKGDLRDIKKDIGNIYSKLDNISNHYSRRLPAWASSLFMVLSALIGGLVGGALF